MRFEKWLIVQYHRGILYLLLKVPILSWILKHEMDKWHIKYANDLPRLKDNLMVKLPEEGWKRNKIIHRLDEYSDWEKKQISHGKFSGVKFHSNEFLEDIAGEASKRFLYSNMIYHDKTTPSRHLEMELLNFVKNLLVIFQKI